jgi:hypothetical protein
MWKTITLCAGLFSVVAFGLGAAARVIDGAVLPTTAALALGLVGVVLIFAAPAPPAVDRRPLTAELTAEEA